LDGTPLEELLASLALAAVICRGRLDELFPDDDAHPHVASSYRAMRDVAVRFGVERDGETTRSQHYADRARFACEIRIARERSWRMDGSGCSACGRWRERVRQMAHGSESRLLLNYPNCLSGRRFWCYPISWLGSCIDRNDYRVPISPQ